MTIISYQLLNTDTHGASIADLSSQFQVAYTLQLKKFDKQSIFDKVSKS